MTITFDATQYTTDELVEISKMIEVEYQKRRTLEQAPLEIDRQIQAYQEATGDTREDGTDWVQPTNALDSYPAGATVKHGGKTWVSTASANVWEPGVAGWRAEATGGAPEWVQPSGATDAYKKGEKVTFLGKTFESLIDANVWSPTDYPAGWKEA